MRLWETAEASGRALALVLAVLLGTGAAAMGQPPIPASPPQEDAQFYAFLRDFRATALAAGIQAASYDAAIAGIRRNQKVEDLNLNQPEFAKPVWSYLDSAVSQKRIAKGAELLTANSAMLANIEARSGVPKEILVSIWGNESNYGQAKESFNMFEALATLAYDGPRTDYARREFLAALKMMERENYAPAQMTSSWAGAFGQTQFVPSTFLAHAVDGNGDGKIDLWNDPADALASAASVLADAGWQRGKPWGIEVELPKDFAYEDADLDTVKPLAEWRKRGVKSATGGELPAQNASGAIYLPAGARGPAFLVFDNFKTILKYNNAASYALAVCELADQIAGGAPIIASWPRDLQPLTRDERLAIQSDLQRLGYDAGAGDGVLGSQSRAALRAYQKARGLTADGFATSDLIVRLYLEIISKAP